jgi:hypothetical protein
VASLALSLNFRAHITEPVAFLCIAVVARILLSRLPRSFTCSSISRRHKKQKINPDRGLNPGPTDIMTDSDVEVCCATAALPGHSRHTWPHIYMLPPPLGRDGRSSLDAVASAYLSLFAWFQRQSLPVVDALKATELFPRIEEQAPWRHLSKVMLPSSELQDRKTPLGTPRATRTAASILVYVYMGLLRQTTNTSH